MTRQLIFCLLAMVVVPTAHAQHYNMVKTTTPTSAVTAKSSATTANSIVEIKYYDDLGRPQQTVQQGINPSGYDLVAYQEYDALGRETNSWLPVVAASGNGGKPTTLSNISTWSATTYGSGSQAYAYPEYEPSPLNRITNQYGPGQQWHSSGKSQKISYLRNNTSAELSCRWFRTTDTRDAVSISVVSGKETYTGYTLGVTKTVDEDDKVTTLQFKNDLGQVVLTRLKYIQTNFYDTYYIYDSYGNLRAVLPPAAAYGLSGTGTWGETNDYIDKYAYLYKYDTRNRLIAKKLPGTGWYRYFYDKADRLIFTQTPVQAAASPQKCSFTLYDDLDRPVVSGTCNWTSSISGIGSSLVKTTLNRSGSSLSATGLGNSGYTCSFSISYPVIESVSYYDDYAFRSLAGFNNSNFPTGTVNAKGLLTGSVRRLLDDSGLSLYAANYYDVMGRVIKTVSSNNKTGYETTTTTYNHSGQPLTVQHTHSAQSQSSRTELYNYSYDKAGRLKTATHKLGSSAAVTIVNNTYDKLGRLNQNTRNGVAAIKTTYDYNVRSWISSITSNLFTETLTYNLNGNIATQGWKTNDGVQRRYNFTYDNCSRLTAADYYENNVSSNKYKTSYVYNRMGSMTSLTRYGRITSGGYGEVDKVYFSYSGNHLVKATNQGNGTANYGAFYFKDGANVATEYEYDKNGNMTKDLNKNISSIQYNSLNLPMKVTYGDGKTASYVYDAGGTKLKMTYTAPSTTTHTIEYCGNMIYEDNVLKQILIDGGYVTLSGSTPQYHFYIQDHLGNNRIVASSTGTAEQINHYYPFGALIGDDIATGQTVQRYRYNGKELDRMNGIDWYDYGARHYDGTFFTTMDPLCEHYYSISPYSYCMDNPIRLVDETGESPISAFAKLLAKQSVKNAVKTYAKNNIERRLKRYMNKEMSKQFAKDVEDVVSTLDDSWWEIGIEMIPGVGEVYGAGKFGIKTAKVYGKLQDIENKYVGKISEALKKTEQRKRFKHNMRRRGVADARKDQKAGARLEKTEETYQKGNGVEGHHEELVSNHPEEMTDPRNVTFMEREKHIKHHQNQNNQ